MSFAKFSSVLEYTASLLKRYNDLQKKINTIYRIVDVKKNTSGSASLQVQVIGRSTFIECSPQEILADDNLLEGFSKKDIRTITYYACQPSTKPKFKLLAQEFLEDKLVFKLKNLDSNEVIIKSAGDILLDKNIIDSLSKEDARSISFAAGYEHSQN